MEFDGEKKTQAPNTQILTDQHQQKDTFMTLRWVFYFQTRVIKITTFQLICFNLNTSNELKVMASFLFNKYMICIWKQNRANATHIHAYAPKKRWRKKLEKNKNGKEEKKHKHMHVTNHWPDTFTVIHNHQNRLGAFSFFLSSTSTSIFVFLSFVFLFFIIRIPHAN